MCKYKKNIYRLEDKTISNSQTKLDKWWRFVVVLWKHIKTKKYHKMLSYLEHIASTSCFVIVGTKFLKKIEVVLWRDFGFSTFVPSSSTVSISLSLSLSVFSFSVSSSPSSFSSSLSSLSLVSPSLSLLLLDELLLPEYDLFRFFSFSEIGTNIIVVIFQ